jgi:hypothetical protein
MKPALALVAMAFLVFGICAAAVGEQRPPRVSGGAHRNHLWVSATRTVEHFTNGQSRGSAPQTSSSNGPNLLPTKLLFFGSGANARCGGGRAVVACPQTTVPAAAPPQPQVTQGVVLTALRRIGLPSLRARTQPEGKTLVNFATIFYTRPQAFTRTVTLLGRRVQIHATPSSFRWHYGDGASGSTSTPGAPYPAKDVTHYYERAHRTVRTSVDVTYTARFRVGNGGWQTIPGAVTIAGPTSPLRISEATAVLSGNY